MRRLILDAVADEYGIQIDPADLEDGRRAQGERQVGRGFSFWWLSLRARRAWPDKIALITEVTIESLALMA